MFVVEAPFSLYSIMAQYLGTKHLKIPVAASLQVKACRQHLEARGAEI